MTIETIGTSRIIECKATNYKAEVKLVHLTDDIRNEDKFSGNIYTVTRLSKDAYRFNDVQAKNIDRACEIALEDMYHQGTY